MSEKLEVYETRGTLSNTYCQPYYLYNYPTIDHNEVCHGDCHGLSSRRPWVQRCGSCSGNVSSWCWRRSCGVLVTGTSVRAVFCWKYTKRSRPKRQRQRQHEVAGRKRYRLSTSALFRLVSATTTPTVTTIGAKQSSSSPPTTTATTTITATRDEELENITTEHAAGRVWGRGGGTAADPNPTIGNVALPHAPVGWHRGREKPI